MSAPGTARHQSGAPSPLQAHVGFWMRVVSNAVSHRFAQRLESSGVTVAEWVILREMYGETAGASQTTTPGRVAAITGLSRGAVSRLIERLLRKQLVTRREASRDRRYQDIRLTRAAVALVPRLARLADENDERFFGVLSKADRRVLLDTLQRIALAHRLKQPAMD